MALNGDQVTVKLGSNDISGINNINFDTTLDQLDVSEFDQSGVRKYIAGLSGATLTIAGDYDPADTNGQVALVNAWANKTLLTGATAPAFTVNGINGFSADAYVSAFNVNPTVEGKVTVSYTLQLTGAITVS